MNLTHSKAQVKGATKGKRKVQLTRKSFECKKKQQVLQPNKGTEKAQVHIEIQKSNSKVCLLKKERSKCKYQ